MFKMLLPVSYHCHQDVHTHTCWYSLASYTFAHWIEDPPYHFQIKAFMISLLSSSRIYFHDQLARNLRSSQNNLFIIQNFNLLS